MPTPDRYTEFANQLTNNLKVKENYQLHETSSHTLQVKRADGTVATLDLRPFAATPQPASAWAYFNQIGNTAELLDAYKRARKDYRFEVDLPEAVENVSPYAVKFLNDILSEASQELSDVQAVLIARWVEQLDVYTAVKAVESLLNSKADLALLEIAAQKKWTVHFDHLAIRCGSRAHQDAERIVELLTSEHGYVATQFAEEAFYQFPDGWNAYPLYKMLDNGQVLRIFVDQSDAGHPSQIIQHWNRVYGYTAHHLAIRATTMVNGQREAVVLSELISALQERGIEIMTPTGEYTHSLLLQVFTRPQRHASIPAELKANIVAIDAGLEKMIENAKLLELVSRKEMPHEFAERYFQLYGIAYQPDNPLHSAPVYQYFLPAQAAHVIRTSMQTA
jgi:hypothetical protein